MKRYLVIAYDVTDLTETQIEALGFEAAVQAERSDDSFGDGFCHPSVNVLDSRIAFEGDPLFEAVTAQPVYPTLLEAAAAARERGVTDASV